ncbi:hypothetical protein D1012_17110 [Pseudotabrizicola alkalilacus]|uniref:Uncharacterized protein n=1 Tax=Pseudotabrizicola alkalilacus TaxID=2305252 RepID=A0A411YZ85_9RHOB|nr:hypothetical protein D1012_17110 [Pseudotabrizicola alkalilacus]
MMITLSAAQVLLCSTVLPKGAGIARGARDGNRGWYRGRFRISASESFGCKVDQMPKINQPVVA